MDRSDLLGPRASCPRQNLLLAHGVPDARNFIATLLRSEGYSLTVCEDGSQALSAAMNGDHRLLIAGIVMPRMDGLELVATLRRHRPDLRSILLSHGKGEIDAVYLRCATLLGADAVFGQPLPHLEFLACVKRLLLPEAYLADGNHSSQCDSV